ncbi:uncharacterized protein BDW47DRAFT_100055 [Aspergillus candidus]|uniref:Uncharacterized protein n=1 Tax=Aspergillus candidus TaxID=41067 RepID=A0A2I2FLA4_ASPCN|nr:hypothetical protein BDW47DRAFT_100055 [Aspergillus candidus]PLB41393.1 hypothetical protein BDW47DRAFT_100055 [Aspergillus candidus]
MVPSGRLQWGTTSGQRHRVQLQARARSVPLEHTSDVRTVVATVHRHRSAVPEQERRPEEVAVDENALRACGDASFAELDGSMLDGSSPGGAGGDVSALNLDIGVVMNEGDHIRNHLQLLNLAVPAVGRVAQGRGRVPALAGGSGAGVPRGDGGGRRNREVGVEGLW